MSRTNSSTPAFAYTTAVPKNNVSKPCSLAMRRSAHASIGLVCPRMFYHLHALASDFTVGQLETSPLVVRWCFPPPEGVEVSPRAIQADPVQWDPEGEAMSTPNQSYEVGGGPSQWGSQKELRWYALHTRARHEKAIERRLRDQGMETFVPTTIQVHRWSDRKKKVEVPLFSCYVFVRCALSAEDRTRVYQVESVHGFVGTRGTSLPIPDEQIESIQKVLTQTAPWRSYPFLKVGQRVRIRGGAMDGVEGVFLSENGDHSLIISVDAIQRSMAVRIDGYDVEPV